MHHALSVPEIVTHIVQLSGPRATKACILVCKMWSEIAIDEDWARLDWDYGVNDGALRVLFPDERPAKGYEQYREKVLCLSLLVQEFLPNFVNFSGWLKETCTSSLARV